MAAFKFDFFTARDGQRLRYGLFHPEQLARGVCVLLSGQSEFIEKYLEVIRELNWRGYTVATFDWRGQGGSARTLSDPLKCHIGDYRDFETDLTSFMDAIVAPLTQNPPLVLAHSMGSHMAIRALHNHPGLFKAAVLVAPMLGIATRGFPGWVTRLVTAWQNWAGKKNVFAWGMAKRDPHLITFDTQLCTSDADRFARTQDILRSHPHIRVAGPTWGWIEAAYRSMKPMRTTGYAEAIRVPVMIVGAGKDRIVKTEATRKFAARMTNCRYVELADSEHEVLMENDQIRARFWDAFDAFTGML